MTLRPASAAALVALTLAGCGDETQAPGTDGPPAVEPAGAVRAPAAGPAPRRPADRLAAIDGDAAVHPVRRLALRRAPHGRPLARVGRRTEFGSPRWMPVVRRKGAWVAVIAPERANGRLGWLPLRHLRVSRVDVRLHVDLSARRLTVRRGGRTVLRMPVGVGAAGTATPTGRFAVTDGLHPAAGSPYGCCILALSGHQPNVPQGWTGGDRIAVHGTSAPSSVGAAVSSGCLRARDGDLRRLMALAQLGSIVRIRA
ncbi:MAG TPA: L,D-transpeptidase [Capillimicrobium sp.]|nr:L,D-transpeptidase [Capillimicrobium sp.]